MWSTLLMFLLLALADRAMDSFETVEEVIKMKLSIGFVTDKVK